MLRKKEFDFSLDAHFKKKLFQQCREQYEKVLARAGRLDDDALELVTAAGGGWENAACPYPGLSCENCDQYLGLNADHTIRCLAGYQKAGG